MPEEKFVSYSEHEFIYKSLSDKLSGLEESLNGLGGRITKVEQDLARFQERDAAQWQSIAKLEAKIDIILTKIEEITKRSVRVWEAVLMAFLGSMIGAILRGMFK